MKLNLVNIYIVMKIQTLFRFYLVPTKPNKRFKNRKPLAVLRLTQNDRKIEVSDLL